jgi:glycosyltransferase involved in cell wall biosynthesis
MAFAFEKPVIITDVFSEKDIVDNKMGYVVPRRNYILLAQKILEFFEEKNRNKFIINIKKYNLSHGFKETAKIHKIAFNSTQ